VTKIFGLGFDVREAKTPAPARPLRQCACYTRLGIVLGVFWHSDSDNPAQSNLAESFLAPVEILLRDVTERAELCPSAGRLPGLRAMFTNIEVVLQGALERVQHLHLAPGYEGEW
jgi:hypothetical protein